jgi:hypothetical protein
MMKLHGTSRAGQCIAASGLILFHIAGRGIRS